MEITRSDVEQELSKEVLVDVLRISPELSISHRASLIKESVDTIKMWAGHFPAPTDDFLQLNRGKIDWYTELKHAEAVPQTDLILASVVAEEVVPLRELFIGMVGPLSEINPLLSFQLNMPLRISISKYKDVCAMLPAVTFCAPVVLDDHTTLLDMCYTLEQYQRLISTANEIAEKYPVTLN